MRYSHKFFCPPLTIILLVFCLSLNAQDVKDPAYTLKLYNDEIPMIQNNVTDMVFDSRNYLWIATQFGLLRYDGRNFIPVNTFTSTVLKYNRIISLSKDASGNIYATDEHWNFYKITDPQNIQLIPDFTKTGFLLRAPGSPVFLFKPITKVQNDEALRDLFQINADGIKNIYPIDPANAYITFTDKNQVNRLLFLNDGIIRQIDIPLDIDFTKGLVLDNQLFFITAEGFYYSIRQAALTRNREKIAAPSRGNSPIDLSHVKFFMGDDIAFFIHEKDLYSLAMSGGGLKAKKVFENIPLGNITSVVYRKEENIYFIGTMTQGFALIHKNDFRNRHIPAGNNSPANNYYAQIEVADNRVLTTNFNLFSPNGSSTVDRREANRFAMLKDRNQDLWYQRNDSLLKSGPTLDRERWVGDMRPSVNCFSEQPNCIWFTNPDKLGYIKNEAIRYVKDFHQFDSSSIQCLGNKVDSEVLVGTQLGFYKIALKDSSIIKLSKENMYVRTIYTCKDGYTWIGTYGQGIYCFYKNKLTKLPSDRMGYLLTAHCFMEDSLGFFWISTNKGLFEIKKSDLINFEKGKTGFIYYHYFDKSDGFVTNEFNGGCSPCGIELADGTFSLPSLNGLVWFNPLKVNEILPAYPLYIDKIKVDSQLLSPDSDISIKASFNQLQFKVSTPYFGNINNLSVEYKLNGLTDDWNALSPDGLILYNKLPKGTYSLVVRKLAGFGKTDYEYRTVSFRILPRIYDTPLYYIFYIATLLGLIYQGYRIRYRWILSSNRKLEKEVQARVKEKEKLIADLEQYIIDLNLSRENENRVNEEKQKLISILVHDLSSPLKFLHKMANRLSFNFNLYTSLEHRKIIRELSASSGEIYSFTDNFLNWLIPARLKTKVEIETFDIRNILAELKVLHADAVFLKNNNISILIDGPSVINSNKLPIRTIVRNLIYYINNNTRDSGIVISFKSDQRDYLLSFKYHGKEIPAKLIKRIGMKELYTSDLEINEIPTYINFGVNQKLADELNGSTHIQSSPEETTISIVFPRTK